MGGWIVRAVPVLCALSVAAGPASAIDALQPRHGPVVVGQDPVDALGVARDPVDGLRRAPTFRGLSGYATYRDGYYRHPNGYWYPRWAFGTGEMLGDARIAEITDTAVTFAMDPLGGQRPATVTLRLKTD